MGKSTLAKNFKLAIEEHNKRIASRAATPFSASTQYLNGVGPHSHCETTQSLMKSIKPSFGLQKKVMFEKVSYDKILGDKVDEFL